MQREVTTAAHYVSGWLCWSRARVNERVCVQDEATTHQSCTEVIRFETRKDQVETSGVLFGGGWRRIVVAVFCETTRHH